MRRQKGVTLTGFLILSVILIFVALLGFKLLPPYMEYMSIRAQLKAIANDPEGRQGVRCVVEDLFDRCSVIENISSVKAKDIIITKSGEGVVLSFDYNVCVPIVLNISACMEYSPTSAR